MHHLGLLSHKNRFQAMASDVEYLLRRAQALQSDSNRTSGPVRLEHLLQAMQETGAAQQLPHGGAPPPPPAAGQPHACAWPRLRLPTLRAAMACISMAHEGHSPKVERACARGLRLHVPRSSRMHASVEMLLGRLHQAHIGGDKQDGATPHAHACGVCAS